MVCKGRLMKFHSASGFDWFFYGSFDCSLLFLMVFRGGLSGSYVVYFTIYIYGSNDQHSK